MPTSAGRARSPPRSSRSPTSDATNKDMKVEIVSADHQNKPDVGSSIANQWFDIERST